MVDRSRRKMFVGNVTSNKMEKTITVVVERRFRHPFYGKYITRSSKLMAHDEKNECGIGDTVRVAEIRPLSRHKRWRMVEIIEKAK